MRRLWERVPDLLKRPAYALAGRSGQGRIIYQARTPYSRLQVVDKNGFRYLVFADTSRGWLNQRPEMVYQSFVSLNDPLKTRATYADYFHLAWIFNPALKDILMIGLGGGITALRFLHDYPEVCFATVEIDPVVVEVAFKYFFLPRDSRHRVIVGDGRGYLDRCVEKYDLILLDAFFSRTIPHRLSTVEFFRTVDQRLTPHGLLGININGAVNGSRSSLFRSIYKTLAGVFPELYLFTGKKGSPEQMQNIILFALKEPLQLSRDEITSRAGELAGAKVTVPGYTGFAGDLCQLPVAREGAAVLRDGEAPPGGELDLY